MSDMLTGRLHFMLILDRAAQEMGLIRSQITGLHYDDNIRSWAQYRRSTVPVM